MQILDYLANVEPEAGVTAIANALGMNKSTCFNILQTLTSSSIVVKDARYPVYRLGPKLVELGTASRRNANHGDVVKRRIRPLVDRLGITCLLGQPLPSYGGIVVVDRLVPRREGVLSAPIGHVYPVTAPAMGRAVIAHEELDDVLLKPADLGLATQDELDAFLGDVEEVRRKGYGFSHGAYQEDVNAAAAVVRGADGETLLVLCMIGTPEHFPAERIDAVGAELRELADTLATEMQRAMPAYRPL